jgi:hypothetical protein
LHIIGMMTAMLFLSSAPRSGGMPPLKAADLRVGAVALEMEDGEKR